ncbi:MAG: prepilin peptidase [Lachnospiraceae bacterium]|nr:prepilin peptidase [Lachnospiraceae bacterium]MDD7627980.1 prepilin peptidase [Lachnospiraceae bacterium]MDY4119761.1 prepilin peptidase [Lachnospiraceae bacterium]
MEYIILYIMIFLIGISIGSFLNVCIYRIPKKEDIVFERSHCMSCGNVLKWYELIPLFSFLVQGGKCRNCKTKLSVQYPLIELLNGLIYVWIFMAKGFQPESILFCICASVLIVISVIDWRTYEIPFGCNIIIGILGIVRVFLNLAHWYDYVIGFFAVSGLFLIIYWITKGRGIGGGDIKLMAAAGLLLGWQNILLALMIGSIAGSVIHLTLMKVQGKDRVLAFGPYLAFGIFAAMLYGNEIITWYLSMFNL